MLLDTSAWVEVFLGSKRGRRVLATIEGKKIHASVLSLAEISDWCFKNNHSCTEFLEMVRKHATVLAVNDDSLESIGEFYNLQWQTMPKFSIVDALIALTAQIYGLSVVSFDHDFEGLKGVVVLH